MNVRVFVALGGVSLFAACGSVSHWGEVYVSPVSTTSWHDYRDRFQPAFELTEQRALDIAVPDTVQLEQSILTSLTAALRVKTVRGDSAIVDPADLGDQATPPTLTAAESVLNADELALDPRLQYLLATALWQEVQMLNRYVVDAGVNAQLAGDEYEPFIVRFQVTGHPDAAKSSYVTDLDLRFGCGAGDPIVVPLLINDHVEAALASRRDEDIRRLTLSLAALFKGIGVGLDLDSFRAEVNRSLAREFNSLLSVAADGASTLRVRLGARRVGDERFVASSEPRFVTALLLVPSKARQIREIEAWAEEDRPSARSRRIGTEDVPDRLVVRVDYTATLRDPDSGWEIKPPRGRSAATKTFEVAVLRPESLWLGDRQTALAFDDGSAVTVTLNDATGFVPDDVSADWYFRDGKDGAAVHVVTSGSVRYRREDHQLEFSFPSLSRHGIEPVAAGLPAEVKRLALGPSNERSAAEAGFRNTAREATDERTLVVTLHTRTRQGTGEKVRLFYPWVYRARGATAQPGAAMTTNRSRLTPAAGRDAIEVHFTLPEAAGGTPIQGFRLFVDGADVTVPAASTAVLAPPAGKPATYFEIKTTGTATLELRGLHAGGKVELSVRGPRGFAVPDAITLTAVASGGD